MSNDKRTERFEENKKRGEQKLPDSQVEKDSSGELVAGMTDDQKSVEQPKTVPKINTKNL